MIKKFGLSSVTFAGKWRTQEYLPMPHSYCKSIGAGGWMERVRHSLRRKRQ